MTISKEEKKKVWQNKLFDFEFQADLFFVNKYIGLEEDDPTFRDQTWLENFEKKYIIPLRKTQKLLGIESDYIDKFYEEIRICESNNTPENREKQKKMMNDYKTNQLEKVDIFSKNASFILRKDGTFNEFYELIKIREGSDQVKILALSTLIKYIVTKWLVENGLDSTVGFEDAKAEFEVEAIAIAKNLLGVTDEY